MKKTLLALSIAAVVSSAGAYTNPLDQAQYESSDFYTTYFQSLDLDLDISHEDLAEAEKIDMELFLLNQSNKSLNQARLEVFNKALDKYQANRHLFEGHETSEVVQSMDREAYDLAVRAIEIDMELAQLQTATVRGDSLRAAIPKYEGIINTYKHIHSIYASIPALQWLADIFQKKIDWYESNVASFKRLLEIEEAIENPPEPEPEPEPEQPVEENETTSKSVDNSNVDFRTSEYHNSRLQYINADAAYKQGWTGKDVTVAVLDTGLATDAPINTTEGYDAWNDVVGETDDTAHNSHGTHVAGIIAAKRDGLDTHGVAFDATILPIRIANSEGTLSNESARAGLDYAVDKAKVANLSFGSKISTNMGTEYIKQLFRNEYIDAINADLTLVISAGNSGLSCLTDECTYPAALPSVEGYEGLTTGEGGWIAVGSVSYDNSINTFSNRAGKMKDYYMVAHGHHVLSTVKGGTDHLSGTSMAAPKVSGAVALLAQKYPHLKGSEIASILFQTTTDLGDPGVDVIFGHGLLNIEQAMAPIGDLNLPNANTVQGVAVELQSISVSPQTASLATASILNKAVAFDSYGRGFNVDLTQAAAVTEPSFDFDTYTFSQNDGILMGVDSLNESVALGYKLKGYSVAYTHSNDMFGMDDVTLSFGETTTHYFRIGHQRNGWKSSLDLGYSSGSSVSNSLVTKYSDIIGLGAAVEWSDDTWSFGVKSPIKIVSGDVDVSVPVGRDLDGNLLKESDTIDMSSVKRSWSTEASYLVHPNKDDDLKFSLEASDVDVEIGVTYSMNF